MFTFRAYHPERQDRMGALEARKRRPMEVTMHVLQVPVLPPQLSGPWSLADSHRLKQPFTEAGFTAVQVTLAWASVDDYNRFQQARGHSTMPDGWCQTENEVALPRNRW